MIVAIDGPGGAGKSTVARAAARALGFRYLDTGAMYRAVALGSQRAGRPGGEVAAVADIDPGPPVRLDGEDVSAAIRSAEVSEGASRVASDPAVRRAVVTRQQALLARGDWVAEGRDIGTVVAPRAELKIYLNADPHERARRRAAELGRPVGEVLADLNRRDTRDRDREHSPLRAADDAVELDTTGQTLEQVVARLVALVAERR